MGLHVHKAVRCRRPASQRGYNGYTPLVQGAALDLTLILLENALCRWALEDLIFFEPAGSILPAAPKEKI